MKVFAEKEWAIADTEHFGRPSRWQEKHVYIRAVDKDKILETAKNRFSLQKGVDLYDRVYQQVMA